MSEPWDGMSKEPLSETELRKQRYQMQFFEENDRVLRSLVLFYRHNDKVLSRAVLILKAWWMLALGAVLAVSGALGGILEIITKKAGL